VAKKLRGFTHLINVQGDEPLIDPAMVSKLATTMAKNSRIEMITAANPFASGDDVSNPNMVKVVLDREGNGLYFSRSPIPYVRGDGVKPAFYRHQGIYGYTTKFLLQFVKWKPGLLEQAESLEQLRALENGAKIRVILAKSAAVGVDTPEDVETVERILASERSGRKKP
jgi:3-deoxy-manno-octulosonate cytidylyltransferase (CMP-KDO synthetase)